MGVNWVQLSSVKDVEVAWRRRMKNTWVSYVCKMIHLTIWWCTSKERNHQIFEDKAFVLSKFQALLFETFV